MPLKTGPWSREEVWTLHRLRGAGTTQKGCANKLNRTEGSVKAKIEELRARGAKKPAKPAKPAHIEIPEETAAKLRKRAAELGVSMKRLAAEYLEAGLVMDSTTGSRR